LSIGYVGVKFYFLQIKNRSVGEEIGGEKCSLYFEFFMSSMLKKSQHKYTLDFCFTQLLNKSVTALKNLSKYLLLDNFSTSLVCA